MCSVPMFSVTGCNIPTTQCGELCKVCTSDVPVMLVHNFNKLNFKFFIFLDNSGTESKGLNAMGYLHGTQLKALNYGGATSQRQSF